MIPLKKRLHPAVLNEKTKKRKHAAFLSLKRSSEGLQRDKMDSLIKPIDKSTKRVKLNID